MSIFDLPGNLGAVRGSPLSVHHADWPAYPQGENYFETLFYMSAFPVGKDFIVIDDIDRSLLLVADVPNRDLEHPLNPRNFHIAAWHEDLAQMQAAGFIDGVEEASEDEWQKARWDDMVASLPNGAKIGYKNSKGNFVEINPPETRKDDYDDGFEDRPFVVSPTKKIKITEKGREHVRTLLASEGIDFSLAISEKVSQLFDLKFYDTCVREACVQLEHEIKVKIQSEKWCDRLVYAYIEYLRSHKNLLESSIRTYRQELRSVFKFIRNEYMHNLLELDERAAYSILFRIARARSILINNDRS